MTSLAAMADDVPSSAAPAGREPGAPVAKDEIDPELVNLRKAGPRFGVVTSAGVAILCGYLIVRLLPDLGFSREAEAPAKVAPTELDGDLDNRFVEAGLPLTRGHAVRLRQSQGGVGMRAVPVSGTSDGLWVLLTGDGWSEAAPSTAYAGRLRALDDLPLADALRGQVAAHPGPSFVTLAQVRASGPVTTVAGDALTVAATDKVELDVEVPNTSVVVVTFVPRLPGVSAWVAALAAAGVPITGEPRDITDDTAHLDVALSADAARAKLDAAGLYARVEAVTTTLASTWGELAAMTGPITIGGTTIDRARVDLVRVFTARKVPATARVLVVGETPASYWYVLPLAIGLALLGALAVWALVRAVKRDLLAPAPAAEPAAAS